jgi:hypothetical protein
VRGRLLVIVALAVVLVGADSADACVCAFGVTPQQRLEAADGALTGRLLGVRAAVDARGAALRYRVGRVFKARSRLHRGQVVTVWDKASGTDYAMPTHTGVVYGLLLTRRHARWTSSLCDVLSPRTLRRAARHHAGASASGDGACSAS